MRTRTPLLNALFALLLVASGVPMPAQPPPPAAGATNPALADRPAAAAEPGAPAAAPAMRGQNPSGQDTLSVDFPDEDIRNILRNVADLFELNLAMPDGLQGKTTIKLKDVTWRQIFQTVLAPVNYAYVEDGNIIKIVSNDSLIQEPVTTEVFLVNYAKASDILPTVTSLVDAAAGGKIVVDARSNALVITERPTRMGRIRPIIEALDHATSQVMIEAKFVEVTNSDVKNLGVNWSSLGNYQLTAGNLGGDFTRSRTQTGNASSTANNGLNSNNQNGTNGQTSVQTTNGQGSTANNNSTVSSSNGVPTNTSSTGTTGTLTSNTTNTGNNGTTSNLTTTATNALDFVTSLANGDATSRSLSAVFSATDFNIVLSALQTLQSTKIISNPTIVTLNNTAAEIKVGQERPIPQYTYNSERGVYEVSGFSYKAIGIILRVTPQVNSRGVIKLSVEPEVSQSNRDASFNGASIPIVESRTAKTQVTLKDGYTMGIGGLLQTSMTNSGNKVPVLGSIPFLGRLFRSDTKSLEATNLIIFITAKTISADGGPVEQIFDSERVRELRMKREDLPGHRDGSNPFLSSTPPPPDALTSHENPPPAKTLFHLTNAEEKK